MYLYGDIHGDWDWMKRIFAKQKDNHLGAIQLGDFGVGFDMEGYEGYKHINADGLSWPPEFPNTFKFIRGNHDKPSLCREHLNYLGEFGYIEHADLFYIGGGFSVDYEQRVPGISWWADEELSYAQLEEMIELFAKCKPRFVVSHECPCSVKEGMMSSALHPSFSGKGYSKTSHAMEVALGRHQPERWYFGHYHVSKNAVIGETRFYCVDINHRAELPGVSLLAT